MKRYLVDEKGATVLGVEIVSGAQPVTEHPFRGPTAFILGNEARSPPPPSLRMRICVPAWRRSAARGAGGGADEAADGHLRRLRVHSAIRAGHCVA